MPGKGINGRANMQKFQGNSKKYGGNPFKFASLVSSTGRVGRGGMWNYIQRRADHYDTAKKTTNVAPTAKPQLVGDPVGVWAEQPYIILTFDMTLISPKDINSNNFAVNNITTSQPIPIDSMHGDEGPHIRLGLDNHHVNENDSVRVIYNANFEPKISSLSFEEADPFTSNEFPIESESLEP